MNRKMLRVTFFGADFPPVGGGISTYSYEWILKTAEHPRVGHVNAMIFNNPEPRDENLNEKLTLRTFKKKGFLYTGIMVPWLMLTNIRSHLFHALNVFPVGFWVVLWSKILFRKSAVTFYGTDVCTSAGRPLTRKLKKWTIENANKAITISEFTRSETKRILFTNADISVIYPLLPVKTLEAGHGMGVDLTSEIKEEDFVILTVCRMVERKGLELLIRAVGMINDSRVKVVMVGGGPEKEKLQKLAQSLQLGSRVIFPGRVLNLEPYYKRAQVVALLSYYMEEEGDFEGLGYVLLEAQYYGTPVIGSNSGGIPETFQNNRTGILVPERSSERVRDAILKLLRDEKWRQTLGKEGQHFVYERFDPDRNISAYINLISD